MDAKKSLSLEAKSRKTILKLLHLTQGGQMEWTRVEGQFFGRGTDNVIEDAFVGSQEALRFAVYEARYQNTLDGDLMFWDNCVVVQILDAHNKTVWTLPKHAAAWDLIEAIRIRAGNVEEKLDDFLSGEED